MRLKSFYAKSMTEAMKMVRDALGEEAIIIATREEDGGKSVRVTAAIEPERMHVGAGANAAEDPEYIGRGESDYGIRKEDDMFDELDIDGKGPAFEIGNDGIASADDWLQHDDEDDEAAIVEELTEVMLRHSVPEEVTDQIISCATVLGMNDAYLALSTALEHLFTFKPIQARPLKKPIMLVGAPGVGKTLTSAKLAARAVMNNMTTTVITTDTLRAGGIEQLQAFTRILKIPLVKATSPAALAKAVDQAKGCDQIVIDTGGANPFNRDDMKALATLAAAADVEPILVMGAGADAEESGEIARVFSTMGVRRMLTTRLDVARRLGGLLNAAHEGGLSFAEMSDTPQVADGLQGLNPKKLSKILMPSQVLNKKVNFNSKK
ncbi:MAG: GTPase [Alphaproteobacteria bacterium]|nr:GTPase [Alphaproteobacteria bacterium]